MASTIVASIIFTLSCQKALSQQLQNSNCHFWSHYNEETNTCDCGSDLFNIVQCETTEGANTEVNVSVAYGYCMTLNNHAKEAVVGACPYHFTHPQIYTPVCKLSKRIGQLCGRCVHGYSMPVYSYYTQCFKCNSSTSNWLKYLAISLLPTTAFWLVITLFRFRATAPQVTGYIYMCQMMSLPIVFRFYLFSPRNTFIHMEIYTFL